MRYFGAIRKMGSETNVLFISALISSFLMLFILIEPLLSPFYHSKQGQVIKVNLAAMEAISDNQRSAETLREEAQQIKKEASTDAATTEPHSAKPKTPASQTAPITSSPEVVPTSPQSNSTNSPPSQFTFNATPLNPTPYSDPIMGGRTGFRSKPPKSPGPQKTTDTASNRALEAYKNQIGKEVDQRHAQAELGQLMGSLELNEEYQCFIRENKESKQKTQNADSSLKVACKPASPKAGHLEWIVKRLSYEEECANIYISQLRGLIKERCSK